MQIYQYLGGEWVKIHRVPIFMAVGFTIMTLFIVLVFVSLSQGLLCARAGL